MSDNHVADMEAVSTSRSGVMNMTNAEMIERIKKTIDQFYQSSSKKYINEAQLHFIGGVLQTTLHLLPTDDYQDIKQYIYAKWGYNPGGIDGQINVDEWLTINDVRPNKIDFNWFRDKYCIHQSGSITFGDEEEASRGCTYKDEKNATCWADWQKCNEENCPFMKGVKR